MSLSVTGSSTLSKMTAFAVVAGGLLVMGGCGGGSSSSNSSSGSATATVEMANAANDQAVAAAQAVSPTQVAYLPGSGSGKSSIYALLSGKSISDYLISPAYAASCLSGGSSVSNTCSNSGTTITRTYGTSDSGCTVGDAITMQGATTFTFSTSGCSMSTANNYVTKTTNLTITRNSTGNSIYISSNNKTDYQGNTYGGGQKLTRGSSAGQYSLDVLGVTRSLKSSDGSEKLNISTHTTSSITVDASALPTLTLNGAPLNISNNTSNYSLGLSMSNVTFNGSCTCPVSGSMTGSYSGSVSGNATITYTGCGTATVTSSLNSTTQTITLDGCSNI